MAPESQTQPPRIKKEKAQQQQQKKDLGIFFPESAVISMKEEWNWPKCILSLGNWVQHYFKPW